MTARIYTAPWRAACKSVIPQLEQLLKDYDITIENKKLEIIDCSKPENYYECEKISALPAIRIYKEKLTKDLHDFYSEKIYEKQGNIMFSEIRKVLGE